MRYNHYNLSISFKRITCAVEQDITISCYGYEDFTERKSIKRMHTMNEFTLQFIEFGKGTLNIDGKIYQLQQGDLFLLPSKIPLMYYHDLEEPYKYHWISIRGENFLNLLKKTKLSTENPVINIADYAKMLELFKSLNPTTNVSTIKIKAVFYSILSMIENTTISNQKTDSHTLFNLIIEYIQLNYSQQSLSIDSIAEQFHINTVTLFRLFKIYCNLSAKEYLISYRIEKAKELIAKGFSISKTSDSCGYTDQYYFSRAFKKHTGETPTQYKKRILAN